MSRRSTDGPRLGPRLLRAAAPALLLPALVAPASAGAGNDTRRPVHEVTVDRAREGATRRLGQPGCLKLLEEYKDQHGQPLATNLATWNRSAVEYLRTTPFRDGSGHPPCRSGKTALFSVVGMRPVFVCPSFKREAERDPWAAEVWLIHEMLHTLGLGENPPSSREITERVSLRCR